CVRPRLGGEPRRRRFRLRGADGRGVHRQPARLRLPRPRGDEGVRQRWYPVRDVGAVQEASEEAALAAHRTESGLRVGVVPTRRHERLEVLLLPDGGARPGQDRSGALGAPGEALASWAGPAAPDEPVRWETDLADAARAVRVEVRSDGRL